jgi:hypothetical protein
MLVKEKEDVEFKLKTDDQRSFLILNINIIYLNNHKDDSS